jgi:hypothetical protein
VRKIFSASQHGIRRDGELSMSHWIHPSTVNYKSILIDDQNSRSEYPKLRKAWPGERGKEQVDRLGLISATATVEETKPVGRGELNLKGTVINSTTLSIRKLLNRTEYG